MKPPAAKFPVTCLMIATPCFRGEMTHAYYLSLHNTMMTLSMNNIHGMHSMYAGESMVHVARNILLAQFMASPCSHIFFIDADMQWAAEDVLRMLKHTEDPECGIVCCAYPKKSLPVTFACNLPTEEKRKGDLAAIYDAPTGFMVCRRDAIQKLMDANPEAKCLLRNPTPPAEEPYEYALFDSLIDPKDRRYLREDFTFTRRWQALGETLWVDPLVTLGHQGLHMFTGSLHDFVVSQPQQFGPDGLGAVKDKTLESPTPVVASDTE